MNIIKNIFREIKNQKAKGRALCESIDEYFVYIEQIFASKNQYIDIAIQDDIKERYTELLKRLRSIGFGKIFYMSKLKSKKAVLAGLENDLARRIYLHNDIVATMLANEARALIGNVEKRQLDDQQMKCIVKPVSNHLVIAGAGTGKTTTIVGKVKYLIKSGLYEPEDILVLSFTNASASEMRERINIETGMNIAASTFHKLGINIISTVEKKMPKITQIQLQKFVRERLKENMKNPRYLELLCKYYIFNNHKYRKTESDFQSRAEYMEYLRMNPPVTLKGELVKSYGEMDIANFLFQNGIAYEYEREYELDTRTDRNAQYYPDFYLTDYGCYIEYFGINEKNEVPSYFISKDGESPSKVYQEKMEWKGNLHKNNNTVLIECYAYERFEGKLLLHLEDKLVQQGVELKPLTAEEIWKKVAENNSSDIIAGLAELMSQIISLMKNNECDPDTLKKISKKKFVCGQYDALIDLIAPIYQAYKTTLEQRGEIDFDDMINKAAHMISDGKYVNPYKYVIVDEYQDISKSRFNLLRALRKSSDYNLFCVGDDWQSIYRFAGSDIDYIINFSKYWGTTEHSKIETTYRFTNSLIEISGSFVMKNPLQIKKDMKGRPSELGFAMGEIKGYTDTVAIRFMINRLKELPANSSVFFIGRYTFDQCLLSNCPELDCNYSASTKTVHVHLKERNDLKMSFITAHRSKGLQADYVFIINNKNNGMGFPSKIQDDPLVECLLEGKETFPFAEERRLFYVAVTRARVKSYLVVVEGNESEFVLEMENRYERELKKEAFTCPLCGGQLEKKSGSYGEFYGCSNYGKTGCTFKRKSYSSKR